jgi:hypothetical protein
VACEKEVYGLFADNEPTSRHATSSIAGPQRQSDHPGGKRAWLPVGYAALCQSAGPANKMRLPSGSSTMKFLTPHGSFLSVRWNFTPAVRKSRNSCLISAAVSSRQQVLVLADIADENWLAYEPQGKPRIVSLDRSVERRIAIGEMHDKPEFSSEEIARPLDVRDEQLGRCCA